MQVCSDTKIEKLAQALLTLHLGTPYLELRDKSEDHTSLKKKSAHKLDSFFQDVLNEEVCVDSKDRSTSLSGVTEWPTNRPLKDGTSTFMVSEDSPRVLVFRVLDICQKLVDRSCPMFVPSLERGLTETARLRFHCKRGVPVSEGFLSMFQAAAMIVWNQTV